MSTHNKDTNRKIRTTFQQYMHNVFCAWLISSQTSLVFTELLLEPFLEPDMYMNLVFLIFLLVSLTHNNPFRRNVAYASATINLPGEKGGRPSVFKANRSCVVAFPICDC